MPIYTFGWECTVSKLKCNPVPITNRILPVLGVCPATLALRLNYLSSRPPHPSTWIPSAVMRSALQTLFDWSMIMTNNLASRMRPNINTSVNPLATHKSGRAASQHPSPMGPQGGCHCFSHPAIFIKDIKTREEELVSDCFRLLVAVSKRAAHRNGQACGQRWAPHSGRTGDQGGQGWAGWGPGDSLYVCPWCSVFVE